MGIFRFEDLEVWQRAIELNDKIFDIGENIYKNGFRNLVEQLRGASLSICNNIAEGAGSFSKAEFKQYLGIAHRSCSELANMVYIIARRHNITENAKNELLKEVEIISKMLTNLRRSL